MIRVHQWIEQYQVELIHGIENPPSRHATTNADAGMAGEVGSDNETDIVSMDGTESVLPI
jgi:hypothetical protein